MNVNKHKYKQVYNAYVASMVLSTTEIEVTRQVINRICHEEKQRGRCSRDWLEWGVGVWELGLGCIEDPLRGDI